jgi:hypothetical protein
MVGFMTCHNLFLCIDDKIDFGEHAWLKIGEGTHNNPIRPFPILFSFTLNLISMLEINKPLLIVSNFHRIMNFYSWQQFSIFCHQQSGIKPFSGVGISHRDNGRCLLRSVDLTPYYADDLSNPQNVKYTLFGKEGDQDVNERRFNHKLLNKADKIYLYRVHRDNNGQKVWTWFGRYRIVGEPQPETHHDIHMKMRIVYLITLVPF